MRVLLDECVDRRLAADIQGHDVKTVPEAGWAALKNSDLLSRDGKRTFLIPVVLPDTREADIPALLKSKRYVDLRQDTEKALLTLVSQIKGDAVGARDLGSYPIPAPGTLAERCESPGERPAHQ